MIFREYLKKKFNDEDIIEFGPLNRPLFTREEYKNISYADIRSTEEIKQLYSGNDYLQKTGISVDTNSIIDIDYKIVKGSYVNTFKEKKFDLFDKKVFNELDITSSKIIKVLEKSIKKQ